MELSAARIRNFKNKKNVEVFMDSLVANLEGNVYNMAENLRLYL